MLCASTTELGTAAQHSLNLGAAVTAEWNPDNVPRRLRFPKT